MFHERVASRELPRRAGVCTHDMTEYKDWELHARTSEGDPNRASCVVVSPYGVPTAATRAGSKDVARQKAREVVDEIIEEYYPARPDSPLGRYPPPLHFHPRPGQDRGIGWVAGRQRISDAAAKMICAEVAAE